MKLNYKKLGNYIAPAGELNNGMKITNLLGISNAKYFVKAKTNTIGIDLETYRIVRKGQFAFNRATTRNGDKISIALRYESDCIVSPSYRIFEVINTDELIPEYLMMWFRRPEFDRYARYKSHGSAHEFFEYNEMCEIELPIPSIEKQRELVKEYHTITDRIKLNEQLNQKLEDTAQSIYKEWFVNFEFPDENGKPYKSNGGEMVYCEELEMEIPKVWKVEKLGKICSKIGSGSTPKGGKENYKQEGSSLVRSMNVYDYNFSYDELAFIDNDQAKKLSGVKLQPNDILLNITGASVARCCIAPNDILPAYVNQHVLIIRLDKKTQFWSYLQLLLSSDQTKQQLLGISDSGSTRQAITKDDIEEFRILQPIEGVINKFEKMIFKIFYKKSLLNQEIKLLSNLKEVLLSKMSTLEVT